MWKEYESYYLYVADKNKNKAGFYNVRRGSITPTKFLSCAGEDPFTTREDQIGLMTGKLKREFTSEELTNLQRGKDHESHIIKMYSDRNPNFNICKFEEDEFPVWKKDTYIRGIPDSFVRDKNGKIIGIVEAKSKNHYNGEISLRDYYQVLGYMVILDAKWTDFCVYVVDENKYVITRINFNENDWNELYVKLCDFKDNYLIKGLKGKKYPIQP